MTRTIILLGLVIPMLLVPATAFALPVQSGGPSGPVNNQAPSTINNHVNTGQLNPGFGCHMELGKTFTGQPKA